MKRILCLLALTAWFGGVVHAQVSFGESTLFNDGWEFSRDSVSWRVVNLPHDWSVEGIPSPSLASCTGYLPGGIGWYRKHFSYGQVSAEGMSTAETEFQGKVSEKVWVYFEGIYNRSTVWINGHEVGGRPNGYISFMCELTPWLREGDNEICVKADHSRSADSRWYSGSGIYRDVYLVRAQQTHLSQWGTAYRLNRLVPAPERAKYAEMEVDWSVDIAEGETGGMEVRVSLLDPYGRQVASAKAAVKVPAQEQSAAQSDSKNDRAQQASEKAVEQGSASIKSTGTMRFKVPKPQLWSLDSPSLYTLVTELWRGGVRIDRSSVKAGLREIRFDPDHGFFLNGENMKIKGVCLHHDFGVLGAAVPKDAWDRRLKVLKGIGVNAIRMSHNPQAPALYDLCDSLGLMVMDEVSDEWEFPKRKWLEGWNVGTPGFQGSYDFFEEWIEKDLEDMIMRDRCHPSVILWSIGNEVDYPNDPYSHPILDGSSINQPMYGGYRPEAPSAMRIGEIAKRLSAVARSVDSSRPVTGALAGVVMSNETAYPDAVDIVGYNYTENRYDIDHAKYPDRIIYGSENSQGYGAWKAVMDRDFICGQFLWTGADYLGESHEWPSRGMGSGLLNFGSQLKPRGWFRASLWSDSPVTYIGTYPAPDGEYANYLSVDAWDTWYYEKDAMIRVVCYTNAPFARLTLNGRQVGQTKAHDHERGIVAWDIPYEEGVLRAEGLSGVKRGADDQLCGGEVVSSYEIRTPHRPRSLSVSADRDALGRPGELAHLMVEVLDDDGNIVNIADNDIRCIVSGPAVLLGLENSNNADMSHPTENHRRAFRGQLLAYIQRTGGEGPVTVRFTSPLLEGSEFTFGER